MNYTAVPLKTFAIDNSLRSISKVRENTNGYKYVTVLNSDNDATNIYLSKRLSELLEVGKKFVAQELTKYFIAFTKNADGEERLKLASGSDDYTDFPW